MQLQIFDKSIVVCENHKWVIIEIYNDYTFVKCLKCGETKEKKNTQNSRKNPRRYEILLKKLKDVNVTEKIKTQADSAINLVKAKKSQNKKKKNKKIKINCPFPALPEPSCLPCWLRLQEVQKHYQRLMIQILLQTSSMILQKSSYPDIKEGLVYYNNIHMNPVQSLTIDNMSIFHLQLSCQQSF